MPHWDLVNLKKRCLMTRMHMLLKQKHYKFFMTETNLRDLRSTQSAWGGVAIELVGIAVKPEFQGRGLGGAMVNSFSKQCGESPDFITAYTRNPSTVGILHHFGGAYPLNSDHELISVANAMPEASEINGTVYHIGRYGNKGLYGGYEPADRSLRGDRIPMKERFSELKNKGSALIVASRIKTTS